MSSQTNCILFTSKRFLVTYLSCPTHVLEELILQLLKCLKQIDVLRFYVFGSLCVFVCVFSCVWFRHLIIEKQDFMLTFV